MVKLREQTRLLTSIVGSYPKPKDIYPKSGRKLLDSSGASFEAYEQKIGKQKFGALLDRAALTAITDQTQAGIDIITDGEERRGHYVLSIISNLSGIDTLNLKKVSIRNGTVEQMAPRVTGKLAYNGSIVTEEYAFTNSHTNQLIKIGLPGPTTVVDCVADEYYKGDKKQLAYDYADAIRSEVATLIKAGCRVIQFDDPVLLRYPDEAHDWGLKALERCFEGYQNEATFIVHICRGYPNKPLEGKGINYKANQNYYVNILAWLSQSKLDVVSIEGAQGNLDLSILPAIGNKTVMLGVLDVGNNKVETVDELTARGRGALRYLPKDQLILAPDCGMIELSRSSAKGKLNNLATAARLLNKV
jgi:5-methyltetrahydropteroyltriglutamate--homocysteine methyltransferase